jgi:hypothetical protein
MLSEIRRTRQDGGLALFEEALAELANHNSTPDLVRAVIFSQSPLYLMMVPRFC